MRVLVFIAVLLCATPAWAQLTTSLGGASSVSGDCTGTAVSGDIAVTCSNITGIAGQIDMSNLPGKAPGSGTFTPTVASAVGTLGFVCSDCHATYSAGPGEVTFVHYVIAGTATPVGASGNIIISGLPTDYWPTAGDNQALIAFNISGWTAWPSPGGKQPVGPVGIVHSDGTLTFEVSIVNDTFAAFTVASLTSGTPITVDFIGMFLSAP